MGSPGINDPQHPSIVRVAADLDGIAPHLRRTREVFGPRAAHWDERFHDDGPAYADAVAALGLAPGDAAVDLGCGTGRALPFLAQAVGSTGVALGVDATPEMLTAARGRGAALALADVMCLPLAPRGVDAFFAAGLLEHVPDPKVFLRSLAAAARPNGRLALFQPIGRAALAKRHGRELAPDEHLDPSVLPGVLADAGWALQSLDDAEQRYLAVASRRV